MWRCWEVLQTKSQKLQEAEAGGLLQVRGQPKQHSETISQKKNKNKTKKQRERLVGGN